VEITITRPLCNALEGSHNDTNLLSALMIPNFEETFVILFWYLQWRDVLNLVSQPLDGQRLAPILLDKVQRPGEHLDALLRLMLSHKRLWKLRPTMSTLWRMPHFHTSILGARSARETAVVAIPIVWPLVTKPYGTVPACLIHLVYPYIALHG
jgi:hypothetical protein